MMARHLNATKSYSRKNAVPKIKITHTMYLSKIAIEVVMPKMNRQIKYDAPSNQSALIPNASQRLILNLSCNSFISGCSPKNIIKGSKSQNFQEVKMKVSMQVAKYESAYPHQLCLDKGSISAMDATRYAVKSNISV